MEKCKIANILEMASRRAKRSEIWDSGVVWEAYVQFLELWPMATFHAKYGNFEKWPLISGTAAPRVKMTSISTPGVERE